MTNHTQNLMDEIRSMVGKPPKNKKWCGYVIARMASDRFPGKSILPLCGYPAWWHSMQRVKAAADLCGQELEGLAVITSKRYENDILERQARHYGYDCIRHDPEYDLPGRKMAAMDYYGCDMAFEGDASAVLSVWEHIKPVYDVQMRYNCEPSTIWHNLQPSGNPARSVIYVTGGVGITRRYTLQRALRFASTPLEHESGTWAWRVPPGMCSTSTPREAYIKHPDWFFDYYRWYHLDIDTHADGVMLQMLYEMFWEGPGTVCSWRKCIDWIDDPQNKDYHYNAISPESAVNQQRDALNQEMEWHYYLSFCDAYIRPPEAPAIYCAECGEYLGYVTTNHDVQRLHRPDNSVITGKATIGCTKGHKRIWQHTLRRTVEGGSAVLVPSDAIQFDVEA